MNHYEPSGTILVIDDNSKNVVQLSGLITREGYRVCTAPTAKEALGCIEDAIPDLILLNVAIDGQSSSILHEQLKTADATKDVPVIFIGPANETDWRVNVFQEGGTDYITCPFYPGEVLARIKTHMNQRRMQEQLVSQSALLQVTETSFRNLFNNMAEGVALHELIYDTGSEPSDYRILSVNPAFETLTGLNADVVIGKLASEVYLTDEPPYLEVYAQTADTGKPAVFTTHVQFLDKYFRISVSSPKEKQFVTVFQDITDQKRTEETLRISLTKYQILFDSFPVGITISDSTGKIVESNQLAEKLLGLSREEQEKRSISGEEWQIVRPDGTPMPPSEFASVRALGEQRLIDNLEMGIVKDQDRITWINVSAAPIPLEGFGVIITYHDISERKKVEDVLRETNAYLENLINYANAPIIVWDNQFRITRFNHAFEFLTGRTEDEVIGKSIEILFPRDSVIDSMALIKKTASGERWKTEEIKIQHIDGPIGTVLWNSATLFKPDGITPIATIAQGQDITTRKQTEAKLYLKNEALLQTMAEKDKFFSIIAHDLRSPFTSFLGFTRMLVEELDEMTLDQIKTIVIGMRKSATNLYRLIENLLEWSMMQRRMTLFNPVSMPLAAKIKETIEFSLVPAQKKEIEIKCEVPDNLSIVADAHMTETVIRNLVSNAVKFTPRNGRITFSAKQAEDHFIEISVRDTGIGMNQGFIERLFKLNEQTGRKGTEGELSTGLGLILCKDFIEKHGGRLWVESEPEKGSVFHFLLPSDTTSKSL